MIFVEREQCDDVTNSCLISLKCVNSPRSTCCLNFVVTSFIEVGMSSLNICLMNFLKNLKSLPRSVILSRFEKSEIPNWASEQNKSNILDERCIKRKRGTAIQTQWESHNHATTENNLKILRPTQISLCESLMLIFCQCCNFF